MLAPQTSGIKRCHQADPAALGLLLTTQQPIHAPAVACTTELSVSPMSWAQVVAHIKRTETLWHAGYHAVLTASIVIPLFLFRLAATIGGSFPTVIAVVMGITAAVLPVLAMVLIAGYRGGWYDVNWRKTLWRDYRRHCPEPVAAAAERLVNTYGADYVHVVHARLDPFLILAVPGQAPVVVAHWLFGQVDYLGA
jgi:hypothetical protein